ncbi:MAG: LysM peptidoglycan-binding domain-containing protein [Candidatus Limnocylindrales bacterium]
MVDRSAASSERAPACPFVAFDDDRDERSDRPDHRHRCYAESSPAPRALAHQESFCLSPTFPTCPTFQDWARREAARARATVRDSVRPGIRSGDPRAAALGELAAAQPEAAFEQQDPEATDAPGPIVAWPGEGADRPPDERPSSASRNWAAPPPWKSAPGSDPREAAATPRRDTGAPAESGAADPEATDAGPTDIRVADAAAGLVASRWLADVQPGDEGMDLAADADRAPSFLSGRSGSDAARPPAVGRPIARPGDEGARPDLTALVARIRSGRPGERANRPIVGQARPIVGQARPIVGQARPVSGPPRVDEGPNWERPRRFEAYPTLRTRVGMPAIPRLALAAIALAVAALALFMVPALFFSKGNQAVLASPTPSVAPSASLAPTATPAPTPLTYTVKPGDTLGGIATRYGMTQTQILQANPQIKDPNKIAIGQVIVIPGTAASQVIVSGPTGPSVVPGAPSATP